MKKLFVASVIFTVSANSYAYNSYNAGDNSQATDSNATAIGAYVLLLQQLALFQKPKEPIILQLVHILHLKVTHRQLLAQMQMLLEITR